MQAKKSQRPCRCPTVTAREPSVDRESKYQLEIVKLGTAQTATIPELLVTDEHVLSWSKAC